MPRWVRRLDRAAADRRNAAPVHPRIEAALRGLSRSADHGVLWFTIAGVLAILGGPRGRRAAARGLASLTASSLIANLIGKRVFGGDRPLLEDVPIGRRLPRPPSSPSFPSGHSASAAGFALGAAVESPRSAAVLGPLAAAVAYSRLHTGSHWLSDVVGGVGIGAAVAGLGALLVRPPDHGPAGRPTAMPALPHGHGLFVVVNPGSGRGMPRPDPVRLLRRALPGAIVHVLDSGEEPSQAFAAGILQHRPRAIGACGGDGTVAGGAAAALDNDLPFAVFPGGTLNHFAGAAGIADFATAIRAVRAGSGITADVAAARIDGGDPITIVNTASVGIYPALVAERERMERRIGKWPAAIVAARRVMPTASPVRIAVTARELRAWSVFVGVNRYFPRSIIPAIRRRLDDGVLDLRIVRADVAASRSRLFANLALGGTLSSALRRLPPLGRLLGVETSTPRRIDLRVEVEPGGAGAEDGAGFAHDGEVTAGDAVSGGFDVSIEIDPRRLRLYAPHRR
ncbi:bifunctional phosphatase PAP2/diacylglycerol kinase family protein [soil metagenome]